MKRLAVGLIILIANVMLISMLIRPNAYDEQIRAVPDSAPTPEFPLGTDELGRDRLSRLLYGSLVSFTLAPAASALSVLVAAVLGGVAGFKRGYWEKCLIGGSNLTLSLPWLFLLMAVRAALPLNTSPEVSVVLTFAILGLLGWAGPAQVVRSGVIDLLNSGLVLSARARGISQSRVLFRHVLPNLRPVLTAQFWTSIPLFVLAEANLGMLGLGVSEPLPSLGNLLKGLETQAAGWQHPFARYWLFAPPLLLVLVLVCLYVLFPSQPSKTNTAS